MKDNKNDIFNMVDVQTIITKLNFDDFISFGGNVDSRKYVLPI